MDGAEQSSDEQRVEGTRIVPLGDWAISLYLSKLPPGQPGGWYVVQPQPSEGWGRHVVICAPNHGQDSVSAGWVPGIALELLSWTRDLLNWDHYTVHTPADKYIVTAVVCTGTWSERAPGQAPPGSHYQLQTVDSMDPSNSTSNSPPVALQLQLPSCRPPFALHLQLHFHLPPFALKMDEDYSFLLAFNKFKILY